MMLERTKSGALVYAEEPVEFVPEQLATTDVSYANLPPQEAGAYALTAFDGGIGLKIQEDQESGKVFYFYPGDVRADGNIINAPLVVTINTGLLTAITDFFELPSATSLYFLSGQYCYKKNVGDSFALNKDFGGGAVAQAADVYQGSRATPFVYVALGATGNGWTYDGTSWVQDGVRYDYVKRWRAGLFRLFLDPATNGWAVSKTVDGGSAPTWGAATLIGDGSAPGTALELLADNLYIAKADGLYGVTSDTTVDDKDYFGGWIKERQSNQNGLKTFAWKNMVFYPTADGGLYARTSDGVVFECSVTKQRQNRSPIRGRVTAMAGDDHWLYCTVFNPLNNESYLLKARVGQFDISQGYASGHVSIQWIGAVAIWTGGVTITAMRVSSVGGNNPRLYMGRSDGKVDYIVLARTGIDAMQDAADGGECRARGTSIVYLPEVTARFYNQAKDYISDGMELEGSSTGAQYVDEEYRVLATDAWSSLGRFQSDVATPITFNNVAGRRLQRRLTLTTTDQTKFTAIRSLTLSYVLRFPDVARYMFTVDAVRSGQQLAGVERADPETIVTAIRNARGSTGAVTLVTPYNQVVSVYVRKWRRVSDAAEPAIPYEWTIAVEATAKAVIGQVAVYGQSRWNGGDVYG